MPKDLDTLKLLVQEYRSHLESEITRLMNKHYTSDWKRGVFWENGTFKFDKWITDYKKFRIGHPIILDDYGWGNYHNDPQDLRKAVRKIIALDNCYEKLSDNEQVDDTKKIKSFIDYINQSKTKQTLVEHRDSPGWHYLKNILLFISSLVGNLGLSKTKFNIFQSRGEQFIDEVNSFTPKPKG